MASPPSTSRVRKLPAPWNELLTGREVRKTSVSRVIKGRVRHYDVGGLTMGHHHPASLDKFGVSMEDKFLVEWEDGRKEALCREELAQLVTQRFVDEEWVLPVVRYLQKNNWEGAEKDIKVLVAEAEAEALAEERRRKAEEAKENRAKAAAARKAAKEAGKAPQPASAGKKRAAPAAAKEAGGSGARAKGQPAAKKARAAPTTRRKQPDQKQLRGFKQPDLHLILAAEHRAAAGGAAPTTAGDAAPTTAGSSSTAGGSSTAAAAAATAHLSPSSSPALDQGASNSMPVPAAARAASNKRGQPAITSPRSGRPAGTTLTGQAKSRKPASTARVPQQQPQKPQKQPQKPQQQRKAGPATAAPKIAAVRSDSLAGPSSLAGPGASAVTPGSGAKPASASAGSHRGCSADVEHERELVGEAEGTRYKVTLPKPGSDGRPRRPIFKYNLRAGPGGKLYRIYSASVIVPEAHCLSKGDRLCTAWKLKSCDDDEYEVRRIVAQRYVKREHETRYLVKWKKFELDLEEDSWLTEEELSGAPDVFNDWKAKGKKDFEKAAKFFATVKSEEPSEVVLLDSDC